VKTPWLALAAAAALAGCSSDRSAGGGGIEIPNGLEVAVRDSTGKPVVGARALVLAGEDWSSRLASGLPLVVDSVVSGPDGRLVLPRRGESFWLEIAGSAGSARLDSRWGDKQVAVLAPVHGVDGQIPSGAPLPASVRLAGTDRVSAVDASGRFRFDGVPRGSYTLVASRTRGVGDYAGQAVLGSAGLERLAIHLDTSGILLDDFEDGDLAWSLSDLFGYSWWWIRADAPQDSLARVFGITDVRQAVQGSASGRWMGVRVLDAAPLPAWSNFGLDLGLLEGRLPTLARFSAVRLKVRGQGDWTLRLATHAGATADTWVAPLSLDTAWKTVRIPASSFVSQATTRSGLPASTRLRNLLFQTDSAGRLDVDDVVLEGVRLEDWILP